MTIADPKFGAELITDKGRIYKYDAAECVVNQLAEEATRYQMLLGVAYNDPKQLFPVDSLLFVISPVYRSPMGANLAAFYRPAPQDLGPDAQLLSWKEVRRTLKNQR
jgi:copper chaperone NosL